MQSSSYNPWRKSSWTQKVNSFPHFTRRKIETLLRHIAEVHLNLQDLLVRMFSWSYIVAPWVAAVVKLGRVRHCILGILYTYMYICISISHLKTHKEFFKMLCPLHAHLTSANTCPQVSCFQRFWLRFAEHVWHIYSRQPKAVGVGVIVAGPPPMTLNEGSWTKLF